LKSHRSCFVGSPGSLSVCGSAWRPGGGRLNTACRILLAIEVAIFLFCVAGSHGLIVPLAKPTSTDFVSFYAAGSLADAGTPQLAYDRTAHYAAEERAVQPEIVYNFFFYPPTFLLFCSQLAHLPYLLAFVAFEAITLGLYLFVIRRVLGERGSAVFIPILAFPPVLWTIGLGQNGFLAAGLLGSATLLLDRRPFAAGVLFGALCFKPHFALLVPVALAAGGRWRALAAAVFSALGLCLLSLALFGWQTWHDFVLAAAGSRSVYASGRIPFSGFVTPFGGAMLLGASPGFSVLVQGVASVAAAAFVAFVWRRNLPLPIRAASLVSATLVAVPLALFYDLVLAGLAAAWLLRAEGKYALGEWGKLALAGLYVLSLNPRGIATASHLPVGPFITVAFAALVAAVAFRGASAARSFGIDGQARRDSRAL
jgi:Glycosyltransferase family 87